MRLISWNVNGLRAAVKKGFEESILSLDADTRVRPGALGELIGDREAARGYGRAARDLVLSQYGPDQLARRLEAALDGILSRA